MKKITVLLTLVSLIFTLNAQTSDSTLAGFKKISFEDLNQSTYKLIANDWALLTGGDTSSFNTMTISWGGFGCLWSLPVTFVFVKPERFTFGFMEKSGLYTLSFFDHEKYKDDLRICGTKSGRDGDKLKETKLSLITTPNGLKAFNEAEIIIECEVVYSDFLDEKGILHEPATKWYNGEKFHKMYVGKVLAVWVKEK
ncbi:MAG: flavin reductase [Bacteroidales bacterium]|nr:flavin reductase [Bacteroidales bacterium]